MFSRQLQLVLSICPSRNVIFFRRSKKNQSRRVWWNQVLTSMNLATTDPYLTLTQFWKCWNVCFWRECFSMSVPQIASTICNRLFGVFTLLLKILNDVFSSDRCEERYSAVRRLRTGYIGCFRYAGHPYDHASTECSFGISGARLEWIKSYLTNRSQFVKVIKPRSSS